MKKYFIAMLLVLLPMNLYSKGLQDETTVGFDVGLRDYDGISDNGTLIDLKGRYVIMESLDLLAAYNYESLSIDADDSEARIHDFEFGGEWNFLPKQEFNPFVGGSIHFLRYGGDNNSENTHEWTFRAGLEWSLAGDWSVTPVISYTLNKNFKEGEFQYALSANKWFNESMSVEFRIGTNEDTDYTTYLIGMNFTM
jgi:hypothetical protein